MPTIVPHYGSWKTITQWKHDGAIKYDYVFLRGILSIYDSGTIVPRDFTIVPWLHRIVVAVGNFSMQPGWRRPRKKSERAQWVEERTGLRHIKLDLSKNRTSNMAKLKINIHTYKIILPGVWLYSSRLWYHGVTLRFLEDNCLSQETFWNTTIFKSNSHVKIVSEIWHSACQPAIIHNPISPPPWRSATKWRPWGDGRNDVGYGLKESWTTHEVWPQ